MFEALKVIEKALNFVLTNVYKPCKLSFLHYARLFPAMDPQKKKDGPVSKREKKQRFREMKYKKFMGTKSEGG